MIKVSLYSSMEGVKARHNLARSTATTCILYAFTHGKKKSVGVISQRDKCASPARIMRLQGVEKPKYTGKRAPNWLRVHGTIHLSQTAGRAAL